MIVDTETGEVLNKRFVKMFVEDYGRLLDLTAGERKVLDLIIATTARGMNGKNRVVLNTPKRKEYAEKLNMKNYRSVNNAIQALVKKDIIKPEFEGAMSFIINPELFFAGNEMQQVRVMTSYTDGKRKVTVIKNDEELKMLVNSLMEGE